MPTKNVFMGAEVSTLANAAKISHMVDTTTIGAFSRPRSNDDTVINTTTGRQPKDPWKRDVWNAVDLEAEKKCNRSTINVTDLQAIQNKMRMKTAERMSLRQVRLEMVRRQNKLNELEQMMQNMKIANLQLSEKKLEKDLLLKEEQIVQLVQAIESQTIAEEEQTKRQIEEHKKMTAEKINRLKRVEELRGYFQSIKSLKDLFIMLFEEFAKTVVSNQELIKNSEKYTEIREKFLSDYEAVLKAVNAGQLSSTEVDQLEKICDKVKEMQRQVEEEIERAQDLELKIAERRLHDQQQQLQLQQQQQQQQQQLQQQQQQPSECVDAADSNVKLHYQKTMSFYESYAESVKPLQNDVSMKKFVFECSKCVNIFCNSVTPKHLQDKFDRLVLVLSGNSIEIGGTRVRPSDHPLGIRYVNLLVAKMFVKQADTMAGLNSSTGFPIAALIVALWQKFPDFGTLFLAYLYKHSPLLVPCQVQQLHGQSTEDYLRSIGFVYKDNVCEEKASFLKRLAGLVRLYASVIVSKSRRSINKPHPHGIECAWTWLTNALYLNPIPEVNATMLVEFITIVGADLWATYKRQFVKLLLAIETQYIPNLNETSGPKSRLEGLIRRMRSENKIDPPADLLPANFW
ncbi:hypothetical protein HA402_015160 [Bradysia odoriphaga]|nr:hypothetical protein HA402_015160 [Bradysia odoriphaga]